MQGKKRIPIRRHRIKVPFKPKSKEYMQGFHDCLDRLATLCFHGPVFLQVMWDLIGKKGTVPGLEVFRREDVLGEPHAKRHARKVDAEFIAPKPKRKAVRK